MAEYSDSDALHAQSIVNLLLSDESTGLDIDKDYDVIHQC